METTPPPPSPLPLQCATPHEDHSPPKEEQLSCKKMVKFILIDKYLLDPFTSLTIEIEFFPRCVISHEN